MEELLRLVHVVGAAVLLGTGAGIAFFMVMAHRTRDPAIIAHVAGTVVIADFLFTTTAVVLQPVSGAWLAHEVGWSLSEGWLLWSLALYVFTGLFWLPVVFIQIELRKLARQSAATGRPLPERYDRLYRIWFACGFPAFLAVIAIFWLMLTRPAIELF
ncbi:hypothetical protein ASC75_01255 [Aminobacter sp. DSM 101952]|uniref:DUF2269 family protein n=1 Tax=Aminobacter sp. DSM 101952 TaxID=2735891 RepID=UPI0006FD90F4|nr:DUF2269 domain-containing protein [Aminobacter sp. DSM 101952]KQU76279.1 hypothetical protein ASC75_01255 [Aminobacter sp. DSM 101952]